ncbi:hypothetical protein MNB_SV-15-92 [hydrothermal vent metagenome]|uniref:Uncharacterized protein n=1 Tax=hydrothermal vent metagenome TaxID=652676 RepID=A0A1W1EI78_9ZZZZ
MKQILILLASGFMFAISIALLIDINYLYSVSIAYISSSIVLLASMKSYRAVVEKAIKNEAIPDDSRDVIDEVEDPYHLFDDNEINNERGEEDLVEVVKEERARLKGARGFVESIKDAKSSLAPYRLLGYTLMIVGFVYLSRNGDLEIIPYIISLSLPILIVIFGLVSSQKD